MANENLKNPFRLLLSVLRELFSNVDDKINTVASRIEENFGLGIVGAEPGQTVIISSIDDDGKPTKWEAVKQKNSEIDGLTEEDAIALVTEIGLVDPVTGENGEFYTDENGAIFML